MLVLAGDSQRGFGGTQGRDRVVEKSRIRRTNISSHLPKSSYVQQGDVSGQTFTASFCVDKVAISNIYIPKSNIFINLYLHVSIKV